VSSSHDALAATVYQFPIRLFRKSVGFYFDLQDVLAGFGGSRRGRRRGLGKLHSKAPNTWLGFLKVVNDDSRWSNVIGIRICIGISSCGRSNLFAISRSQSLLRKAKEIIDMAIVGGLFQIIISIGLEQGDGIMFSITGPSIGSGKAPIPVPSNGGCCVNVIYQDST
jgi:hypothetical protein